MSKLTKEAVLEIANEVLAKRQIKYDLEEGLEVRFNGVEEIRDNRQLPIWSVSYLTPPSIFEQKSHYILINDNTGEFLYIITPTTYIE